MSADRLREAAAKMRERVERAKVDCGLTPSSDAREMDWFGAVDYTRDLDETYDAVHAHVASWHPAVALAVADWLDREADIWEQVLVHAVQYAPKVEVSIGLNTHAQAVAVADAYLGAPP